MEFGFIGFTGTLRCCYLGDLEILTKIVPAFWIQLRVAVSKRKCTMK